MFKELMNDRKFILSKHKGLEQLKSLTKYNIENYAPKMEGDDEQGTNRKGKRAAMRFDDSNESGSEEQDGLGMVAEEAERDRKLKEQVENNTKLKMINQMEQVNLQSEIEALVMLGISDVTAKPTPSKDKKKKKDKDKEKD